MSEIKKDGNYRVCRRCIMDSTVSGIQFDDDGICDCCKKYQDRISRELHYDAAGKEKLKYLVENIKKEGRNKKYDCIVGLSGGLDSSFLVYKARELGLRMLAVHVDNGWDTELSRENIEKLCNKLDIDLHVYKVDWQEFRDLQLSFLKASVINAEMPTDHLYLSLIHI